MNLALDMIIVADRKEKAMRRAGSWSLALLVCFTAAASAQTPRISILVDLDPQRVDRSAQIESITADAQGRLYVPDNVTGNILRVEPKAPAPVVVGKIPNRERRTNTASNGLAFNRDGDLFIAKGAYNEVLRIRKSDLNADRPGVADTFATDTNNANGLAFDRNGNLFVSGTATGNVYRVRPEGGRAEVAFHREAFTPNGLAFDSNGILHVTDTPRGEIWKVEVRADGSTGEPTLFVKSPLLERIDGIAFDAAGIAWCTLQRNAIVTVTAQGAIREVASNGSRGPLEAPTAIVFVGPRAYVNNNDTVAPPNGDGKTSDNGTGASIAQIDP